MSDNPYAAPQFPGDLPPTAGGIHGPPGGWNASEVIGLAWEIFKKHWAVLFGGVFLVSVIAGVPGYIASGVQAGAELQPGTSEYVLVQGVGNLLDGLLSVFFSIGQVRLFLQAARGRTPDFGVLFSGMDRFPAVFVAGLIAGILYIIGFVLLIVPMFILIYGLYFATWFVVDHQLGPVEALKKSWEVTNGHKLNLFLFSLLSILVGLAGCAACLVGIYAAQAVIGVASAIIFLRLTGEQVAAPTVWGGE